MDDLIYTLLFIGWIVYGIYSAVKKNKAKANSVPAPQTISTENKSTVETVLENLFQESTQNYDKVNSPYYASDVVEESKNSLDYQDEIEEYEELDYLDTIPEPTVESKIDTYSGTDNAQSVLVPEEEMDEIQKSAIDNDSESTTESTFDLRQAIIAQAVLERPYE
jgi:hypothetical protein